MNVPSIFTKNGQSNLVLVLVLVLESKSLYYFTVRRNLILFLVEGTFIDRIA